MQLGRIDTRNDAPNRAYNVSTREVLSHCHKPEKVGEKTLEAKFRKEIESHGWMALKLLPQMHRGLPDRLVLAEFGITFFAEIKTTGKKPTILQLHCHETLRKLGFQVFIIDSMESLEMALSLINRAVIAERIRREEFGEL